MPQRKKKNQADSDTSDSGPEDVNPPAKKSKPEAKTSSRKDDDDEEPSWSLDKSRSVKVREFKGKLMVDIREYYDKDGEMRPGKKGIALSAMQWRKLVDAIPEIDEAIKRKA